MDTRDVKFSLVFLFKRTLKSMDLFNLFPIWPFFVSWQWLYLDYLESVHFKSFINLFLVSKKISTELSSKRGFLQSCIVIDKVRNFSSLSLWTISGCPGEQSHTWPLIELNHWLSHMKFFSSTFSCYLKIMGASFIKNTSYKIEMENGGIPFNLGDPGLFASSAKSRICYGVD